MTYGDAIALGRDAIFVCFMVAAPVLLMTGGASDPFYTPVADELARRIPAALRDTLDGLAHPGPIVRPDRVAAAVAAFLARLEPAAE